jgi:hypothetical protein
MKRKTSFPFAFRSFLRTFATRTKQVRIMTATVFNPLQIHLLQMFALDKRQCGLEELKDVLYRHYSKRMEERLEDLWESGKLDQKRLDEINAMDLHQLK